MSIGAYYATRKIIRAGARGAAGSRYGKTAIRKVLSSNVAFRASSTTTARRMVRAYYKSPMTQELVKIGAAAGAAYGTAKAASFVFKAGRRVKRKTKYAYYSRRVNKPGTKGAIARRMAGANAPRSMHRTAAQRAASRRNIRQAQAVASARGRAKQNRRR